MTLKRKHLSGLLCLLFLFLSQMPGIAQFQGILLDEETEEPLVGACLVILKTQQGTCTDAEGKFIMEEHPDPPFEVEFSYLGYAGSRVTIEDVSQELQFKLGEEGINLTTIEVTSSYSRLKQELSLTVESITLEQIRNVSESSFYDALASMRETDLLTVSFGVKVINSRGFNSSTPIRSLQLIDGVDNASPGLNYPLGNFMGLPELDVEGVDLVIGASSAHFGPGAFNGVVNMRTKNPFRHQGLEIELKGGERNYFEGGIRYGKAFKNKKGQDKLGVKFNLSYARVYDWEADDSSPSIGSLRDSIYIDNPGGYDAVNKYGDETNADFSSLFEQLRHPGLGQFHRTGYWEKDLTEYDSWNLKTSGAIHYMLNPEWEMIASANFGTGTTVMQLDNRLNLNGVWAMQNRFEIRKKNRFFARFYTTREDAGNTFDIVSTASILQARARGDQEWLNGYKSYWFKNINPRVKELPGFPKVGPPPNFEYDFEGAQEILQENEAQIQAWHEETRKAQDGRRFIPGTLEFDEVYNDIINTKVSEGGTKYVDKSKLYHGHAEYKFHPSFVDDITIGGNFRYYAPYSEGTIFADTTGAEIRTYEYGMYVGLEKKVFNNRLKLNLATRVDKHENYDYLFSPAFSANYILTPLSSLRFSVSSALRNPTLIEQYYFFRVGSALLLGNIVGYNDLITVESFENYLENSLNADTLVYFSEPPIKPEKALATELAYSGVFFDNKLDVNSTLYFNRYKDFIGYKIGLDVPFFMGFPGIPAIYRFAANAKNITYTSGFSLGMTFYLSEHYGIKGNYSWNRIFQTNDDPLIPAYNTPEHKFNIGFGGEELRWMGSDHWGFGVNFRWVEGYTFESSPQFSGTIPAQLHLNAQINKKLPKLGSTLKLSGSNLLNRRQNGLYGGPKVGRFVYLSWYFSVL